MEAELSRTGVEMPQFRNLGGMLADQGGGDRKKIARAVQGESLNLVNYGFYVIDYPDIINSVAAGDTNRLLECLKNPVAGLRDIVASNTRQYQMVLECARAEKHTGLLSQAEIQGHVTRVNLLICLERVAFAVRDDDTAELGQVLGDKGLDMGRIVKRENIELYLTHLVDHVENLQPGEVLKRESIIAAVESANLLGMEREQLESAMLDLNRALRSGTVADTFSCLAHPSLRLTGLEVAAQGLYHSELRYIQSETGADLTYEGVCLPVHFLNLVASVGTAALAGDQDTAWRCLSCPDLAVQDLDHAASVRYGAELVRLARNKGEVLTHGELQLAVDRVNSTLDKDIVRLTAVEAVNTALSRGGRGVVEALQLPGLGLENIKIAKCDEVRYIEELQGRLANKSVVEEQGVGLWYEDIVGCVETVAECVGEVESFVGVLRGVNSAVDNGDQIGVFNYVSNNGEKLGLTIQPRRELAGEYLKELQAAKKNRRGSHSWVEVELCDASSVWVEVEGGRHSWMEPNIRGNAGVLSVSDIRLSVGGVSGVNSQIFLKSLIFFQARARGAMARSKLFSMLDWYYKREKDIIKVQAIWRGRRDRKRLAEIVTMKVDQKRRSMREKKMRDLVRYEKQVILIQRAWRKWRARKQWAEMLSSGKANLETVVRHMHLLDIRDHDFREELDLQSARGDLSKLIRQNEQLEQELDQMDVKIGLLVQNRISVQDCLLEKGKGTVGTLRRERNKDSNNSYNSDVGTHRGLKALKKESHDKLLAYQHLFYLLQTDPTYLARLIFAMPQSKTNKFLESVILTLYNFGGNAREEFLLLQLFKTALVEEVII